MPKIPGLFHSHICENKMGTTIASNQLPAGQQHRECGAVTNTTSTTINARTTSEYAAVSLRQASGANLL